jgi:hypothetical protein
MTTHFANEASSWFLIILCMPFNNGGFEVAKCIALYTDHDV